MPMFTVFQIFLFMTPKKKYISYCDSVQTFISIMETRVSWNEYYTEGILIYLFYAMLCYAILSYPISFHSIPLLYYLSLGFPRSRPWDTDSNANSLLWRWCQETPVEQGNEAGKARQPVKVQNVCLTSESSCPRRWGNQCVQFIYKCPQSLIEGFGGWKLAPLISWYFWSSRRA